MATTKTGSVSKTYGNLENDGEYDFRLGSFSPMPKIPAGAKLDSLKYDCKARRNWGASGANGKVEVDAGGTLITVISGMKYNTDYDPAPVELQPYTFTYADGTILFSNGSDELHVEVQHNTSILGTSWWMITENVITAYYSLPVYTITVNASPTAGGTVTGDGNYDNNTTATLTATPNTGYKFKQWNDGNTSATRTITATADATYTAEFEPITYYVQYHANNGTDEVVTETCKYDKEFQINYAYLFTWPTVKATYDSNGGVNLDHKGSEEESKPFRCWKDANSGIEYEASTKVKNLSAEENATVHLYAQWSDPTVTMPNVKRSGYEFLGWECNGNLYAIGEEVTISTDVTFTAQWDKLAPEITSVTITRSSDLAQVTINTPVDAGSKYIISVEVT